MTEERKHEILRSVEQNPARVLIVYTDEEQRFLMQAVWQEMERRKKQAEATRRGTA